MELSFTSVSQHACYQQHGIVLPLSEPEMVVLLVKWLMCDKMQDKEYITLTHKTNMKIHCSVQLK